MTNPKIPQTATNNNPDVVLPTYHPEVPMDFSRFMKDTVAREAVRKLHQPDATTKEVYNPNKEYMKRYYESATGRMWLGRPRYR